MVVNPFESEGCRYPDESIVPTGLVRLQTSTTLTTAAPGSILTVLNWKVRDATAGGAGTGHATIIPAFNIGGSIVNSDYGVPQAAWRPLVAIDRTLAAAIRVRLMGLPVSTFVPSGTLYFLQYQPGEALGSFDTETECIQAVVARKGFSLTLAEIAKLGAIHVPYLPQGPMSYVFSQSNSIPASGYPDSDTVIGPVSSVVAPNGGLVVAGFGLQSGVVLRFDYSHHVEYIPQVASAGLIETKVELPSASAREFIAKDSQAVISVTAGGTSSSDLVPLIKGQHVIRGGPAPRNPFGSVSSGLSTLDSMVSTMSGLLGTAGKLGALFGGI